MVLLKKLLSLLDPLILPKLAFKNRVLLWQLAKRNIVMRYRGSILGLLWSFIQPLMMLTIYTFVFSVVFKARWGIDAGSRGAFAVIMFCGMAHFTIFADSVNACCTTIIDTPNFVKKVIFPLEILPLAQVVSTFFLGLIWILLVFLGVIFIYGKLSFTMLLLPLIQLPLFLFSLGIGYLVASLGVYVRDTKYVVGVIMQVLFFMTPIFYPVSAVPEKFRWVLNANPLTVMIEEARKVFLYGQLPDWEFLARASGIAVLVLYLGFMWFYKTKKGFADVL